MEIKNIITYLKQQTAYKSLKLWTCFLQSSSMKVLAWIILWIDLYKFQSIYKFLR